MLVELIQLGADVVGAEVDPADDGGDARPLAGKPDQPLVFQRKPGCLDSDAGVEARCGEQWIEICREEVVAQLGHIVGDPDVLVRPELHQVHVGVDCLHRVEPTQERPTGWADRRARRSQIRWNQTDLARAPP